MSRNDVHNNSKGDSHDELFRSVHRIRKAVQLLVRNGRRSPVLQLWVRLGLADGRMDQKHLSVLVNRLFRFVGVGDSFDFNLHS